MVAEGVSAVPAEQFAYASWGHRLLAYLLDVVIIVIAAGVLIGLGYAIGGETGAVIMYLLAVIVGPGVYLTYFHGSESGQTPGKRVLGIRVRSEAGGRLGYGRALGRWAIGFVFAILLYVPLILDYLWPLWDARNQALHDKVAGSIVVRA
jgi:uncharacterized RDD family membrane protein YckC